MDKKEVEVKKKNKIETIEASPEPEIDEEEDKPSSVSDETESHKKEALKKKQNGQIIWAVTLMICIIVIILAVPYLRDNVLNKFNYHGMTFQKTKIGQLAFYTTKLPVYSTAPSIVTSLVGNETPTIKQTGTYELNLRNDPRGLDNITVELDINNITFVRIRTVYVTYNASDPICYHNVVAAADLANFLLNFGNFDVKGAFMDKDFAEAKKVPYATCDNNPGSTVIMIVAGNENRILKVKDRCYKLEYANCDISGVTDKFILSMAEGYMNSVSGNNNGKVVAENKSI